MSAERAPRPPGEHAASDQFRSLASSYGRGVRSGVVILLLIGVILLTLSAFLTAPSAPRSVLCGSGVIAISSAATGLVAAQMYRVAPVATAPALAALYLLKVLVLGWFLLAVGAPVWLAPRVFAVTVLVCLVLSLAGFGALTRAVTRRHAPKTAPGRTSADIYRAHDDAAAAPPVLPARDGYPGGAGTEHSTRER